MSFLKGHFFVAKHVFVFQVREHFWCRFHDAWRSGHADANTFTFTGAVPHFVGRSDLPVVFPYESIPKRLGLLPIGSMYDMFTYI